MKMKISDILRKSNDETMAKIIGAVIAMHYDGISEEEAIKLEYPYTLETLQSEMEVDYTPTNADRIRAMNIDELALVIMCPNEMSKDVIGEAYIPCDKSDECNCFECCKRWLQQEVEE